MATDRITLPELEQHLVKAADLRRGSIDQADFRAYTFSDHYAKECAAALAGSVGDRVRSAPGAPQFRHPQGLRLGGSSLSDGGRQPGPEGWQSTTEGDRLVQQGPRKTVYIKFKIRDNRVFEKDLGYVCKYY